LISAASAVDGGLRLARATKLPVPWRTSMRPTSSACRSPRDGLPAGLEEIHELALGRQLAAIAKRPARMKLEIWSKTWSTCGRPSTEKSRRRQSCRRSGACGGDAGALGHRLLLCLRRRRRTLGAGARCDPEIDLLHLLVLLQIRRLALERGTAGLQDIA